MKINLIYYFPDWQMIRNTVVIFAVILLALGLVGYICGFWYSAQAFFSGALIAGIVFVALVLLPQVIIILFLRKKFVLDNRAKILMISRIFAKPICMKFNAFKVILTAYKMFNYKPGWGNSYAGKLFRASVLSGSNPTGFRDGSRFDNYIFAEKMRKASIFKIAEQIKASCPDIVIEDKTAQELSETTKVSF